MSNKKNMFDAAMFQPNKFEMDETISQVEYQEQAEEPIANVSAIKRPLNKRGKGKSYSDVFAISFDKEDKNNIGPVNIYASVQAKLNTLKLLHPKKSKIDIVNSILQNYFDENAVELNEEITKYQSNLKTFF